MNDATGEPPTLSSARSGAGQVVAGRYHVRARLGRGATKDVYLAYDERLDREVALALVVGAGGSAVARARVEREARVTGRLGDHPNVVTVYDTGAVDDLPYLVLRAMRRGALADALATERPTPSDVVRIGRDVASALAHAHAHGVVHRDVKPDNVWLADDGTAALGDFGVAQEPGGERLTAEGVVVGTLRYIAPEQIRGDAIGPACDLYALGVTLYELATGAPPFPGHDQVALFAQHLSAVPVPPSRVAPEIGDGLERLILALLEKDPTARPHGARAVVALLDALAPPTVAPRSPRRARRVVGVVAARVHGDDPEALHAALDRCAAVIEAHGGAVEPHLGTALIGLFGLDAATGDEVLRAAQAAVELRATAPDVQLGVEAGEVFVAPGPRGTTTVTGHAVTGAGRLAWGAAPGAIRIGDAAHRAIAADAHVEDGALLELHAERPALLRAPATAFAGRAPELAALQDAFDQACAERVCRLVTIVGPPGIGKSRLVGELLARLGDRATVLAARCPPYGEDVAQRPLRDLLDGLGDDGAPERGALLMAGGAAQPEERAWALRRLLERVARDRPLVVALEDLHWADAALLDLLDQATALARDAPLLVVCLARAELLDRRPRWAAPHPQRTILLLDGLADDDARALARGLGAAPDDAARFAARAEGNPLFVEQLVAFAAPDGALPVSVQAVLAARIDGLDPDERALVQHAAVEGRTFHAGALAALLPDGGRGARTLLVELARTGLVAGDAPRYPGEDAFRFAHALIHEAAYAGLPKQRRAELHRRLADWLEDRTEAPDEVVGHHLEQACLLAAELGHQSEASRALAARAARRLRSAARTAGHRGDADGSCDLLQRAVTLSADDAHVREPLLTALGAALVEAGRLPEAARVLDQAVAETTTPAVAARARIERAFLRLEADAGGSTDAALALADTALDTLAAAGDADGQSRAWWLRAHAFWTVGRVGDADAAWARAAALAQRAGAERELFAILGWRATAAVLGPTPVDVALRDCEEFHAIVVASPVAVASMVNPMASLHAMQGDFARAEEELTAATETLETLGTLNAGVNHHAALVRMIAGQPDRAEAILRDGAAALAAMGDRGVLATTHAMLAQAVRAQGRDAEAADLCRRAADAAAADDLVTQVLWRSVLARCLVGEGRCEEALTLARRAAALIAPTDLISHRADAMLDLAEVLWACSSPEESLGTIQTAVTLYEQKGNAVAAQRARALLTRRSEER